MDVPLVAYTVEHYNSLPELRLAKGYFEATHASKVLFEELAVTFVQYGVQDEIGVTLLHNHFLMEPNEMLVNIGSVAIPWNKDNGAGQLKDVNASSWRFMEAGLMPYEFTYSGRKAALDSCHLQRFLGAVRTILVTFGLVDVFGICLLDGSGVDVPATTEFTSGRANVTLSFDIAPNDGMSIDAMWQFHSGRPREQGV
ncbi:MAG: hypothetical protein Q9165_003399 [Trypethelium subeluteriae]